MRDDVEFFDGLNEPEVVCWRRLDDPTSRLELDRLSEWIAWVTQRYQLDYKVIPDCWAQHGALVEELSALRSLWEGCFQPESALSEPIAFHRELDATLRRLREWNSRSGCTRTVHRDVELITSGTEMPSQLNSPSGPGT